MTSKWYQSLFSTRPVNQKQALQEFETGITATGSRPRSEAY
jgi:hypothetical protein